MIGILIFQLFVHPVMAQEIVKLPALLEHFYHHNDHHQHTTHHHHHDSKANKETGWISFFEDHYGNSAISHSEESHDKLPFKHSSDHRVEQLTIQLFIIEPNMLEIHSIYENEKKHYLTCSSFLKNNYLQTIWQPPKIS